MITRPRSRKLVEDAYKKEKRIAVVCQKESKTQDPKSDDLYTLGTTARVLRILNMPDNSIGVILEGFDRIAVDEFITDKTTPAFECDTQGIILSIISLISSCLVGLYLDIPSNK